MKAIFLYMFMSAFINARFLIRIKIKIMQTLYNIMLFNTDNYTEIFCSIWIFFSYVQTTKLSIYRDIVYSSSKNGN